MDRAQPIGTRELLGTPHEAHEAVTRDESGTQADEAVNPPGQFPEGNKPTTEQSNELHKD